MAGHKRTLSEDLAEIREALRRLGTEKSSSVPSLSSSASSSPPSSAASSAPSTDIDAIVEQAIELASERGKHLFIQDIERGIYGPEHIQATIRQIHAARKARSQKQVQAAGLPIDGQTVEVLAQGINSQNQSSSSANPVVSPPGTVWAWTKYYKKIGGTSSAMVHLGDAMDVDEPSRTSFDLLSSVASCPSLAQQVCSHLLPRDIGVLYRTSRVFKATMDADLGPTVLRLAKKYAPEALSIFPCELYGGLNTVTTEETNVDAAQAQTSSSSSSPSSVLGGQPTLRYLNLLLSRQRKVRDIVACLARNGHRLPRKSDVNPGAAATLKKLWLLMDVATNKGRCALIARQDLFTDHDLLTLQMFLVKLTMHFSDPGDILEHPLSEPSHAALSAQIARMTQMAQLAQQNATAPHHQHNLPPPRLLHEPSPVGSLVEVFMGQRTGLHPLWCFLRGKQYRTPEEVLELKVRYDYVPGLKQDLSTLGDWASPDIRSVLHGVPLWEMGVGQFEGWGLGLMRLKRIDELLPMESVRRELDLDVHLPFMPVWGYRDFTTGANLVPSIDELYMSDEDEEDKENRRLVSSADYRLAHKLKMILSPAARIARRCGNVPFQPGEWQPWQVLKTQWPTLSMADKLDIWWICHQERLKSQPWVQDGDDDGVDDDDDDKSTDDGTNGGNLDNNDHDDGYGDSMHGDSDSDDGGGGGWGRTINGLSSNIALSTTASPLTPTFSTRHQQLITTCVQTACRQQEAADAALLAQADNLGDYDEAELRIWEEALDTELEPDDRNSQEEQASHMGGVNPLLDLDPDDVNIRAYGGGTDDDDVLALLQQLETAESEAARVRCWRQQNRQTTRFNWAAEVARLKDRLEVRLAAEVFATDIN